MTEVPSKPSVAPAAQGSAERVESTWLQPADEVRVPDVELMLPAEEESVALARQMALGVADHLGLEPARAADIALAVTEACTNAVIHAYPDGEAGVRGYEVRVWTQPHRLVVAVSDHGRGIEPRVPGDKPGLGLGLPLMLAVCDEVTFSHGADRATVARMTFRLDGSGA